MSNLIPRSLTVPLAVGAVLLVLGCAQSSADTDPGPAPAAPAAAPQTPPASPAPAAPAAAQAPATPGPAASAPAQDDPVLSESQIPDIVATVDGVPVTKVDLLSRATEAQGALAQRGVPPQPTTRSFYRAVLDDLIGSRLLAKDLDGQGKSASAQEIDQQLAAVRGQFKTEQEFDDMLKARGFDRERLRREIAESLTVNRWVQESVIPSIKVTEAEQRQFYSDNQDRMLLPEGVRVRHILVIVTPKDSPQERAAKRQKAQDLRAKVAAGADFATVAKESSEDPGTAPKGGEVGWIQRGQTVPLFEQAAFALEPGKLSEIVETRFGYHVIQVEEKRAETKLGFDEVKERIDGVLKQHKLEEAVRVRLNELGAKAKIDIKI